MWLHLKAVFHVIATIAVIGRKNVQQSLLWKPLAKTPAHNSRFCRKDTRVNDTLSEPSRGLTHNCKFRDCYS